MQYTLPNLPNKGYQYLENRFGVTEKDLKPSQLIEVNGDLWIHTSKNKDNLEYQTQGIRALRKSDRGFKPTTYFLQQIGEHISTNKIEMTEKQFQKIINREMFDAEREEDGYVALSYQNSVIGCGFYKNQKISTRIPKNRSKELKKIFQS